MTTQTQTEEPKLLFTRPELLSHPNIPKPLHGLAPRTLMKQKEWNETRRKAYAENNYHCWACGVYRSYDMDALKFNDDSGESLDAHESYTIDYEEKTVVLNEIVALCKNCHNYIHSGRMNSMYDKGQFNEEDCWIITQNGNRVLEEAGLEPNTEVDENDYKKEWDDWRLIFNGKHHKSKWRDYWDWLKHYGIS